MALLIAAGAVLVVTLMALWVAVAPERLRVALGAVAATGAVVAVGVVIGLGGVVDMRSATEADRRVEAVQEVPAGDDRPSYDASRVAIGLSGAGACLLVAVGLWRRTEWTAVGGDPFAGVEVPSDPFGDRVSRSSGP